MAAENLYSPHLQGHLETFLSYLTFWQDVLEHCRSLNVRQTLLDHLQVLFLQQLLLVIPYFSLYLLITYSYPSMLESSDVDGGSSVAVLTYLRRILDSLDHTEMVHLVLQYLLALPELTRPRSPRALSRKTSLLLLTQPENEEDRLNPALFNLVDLLQSSVTSSNAQTVIAALKLATVVVGKNHPYAVDTLLQTTPAESSEPLRTHGSLDVEMQTYLSLAEDIGGETGLDEAYEGHLKDTLKLIELHVCSSKMLALNGLGISSVQDQTSSTGSREVSPHFVQLDDEFLAHLLTLLESFLTNNIEVNLALTESLISLVSCPRLRLEGLAAVDPRYYILTASGEDPALVGDSKALHQLKETRRHPSWQPIHNPLLLAKLQGLQGDIRLLRTRVPDFHQLVSSRKQAFRLHEEITEAIMNAPLQSRASRRSRDFQGGTGNTGMTPLRPAGLPQRILSAGSVSGSPSRSQSPRGRKPGQDRGLAPTSSPGPSSRSILSQYAPGLDPTSPPRSKVRSSEPMRVPSDPGADQIPQMLLADVIEAANSEALTRRITFPLRSPPSTTSEAGGTTPSHGDDSSTSLETAEEPDDTSNPPPKLQQPGDDSADDSPAEREASLSHILTNVVILQEFVLELVAIMQVRASMFGEVKFA
jgi:hypothetical protein